MPHEEKFGSRCLVYSIWHRLKSIVRFLGDAGLSKSCTMIDLDGVFVEANESSLKPIALVETARDVGQDYKCAKITKELAKRCFPEVEAYVVLYKVSETEANPAFPDYPDIESFRVRRLYPEPTTNWETMTPSQYANWLVELRERTADQLDSGSSHFGVCILPRCVDRAATKLFSFFSRIDLEDLITLLALKLRLKKAA